MDIKLLRSFVQLIDAGHYGRASSKLFVTQSTLSKQIQALETMVGGPLFERGRHGAKLTPLGKLLQQEARVLLRLSDDLDVKMHRANAGLTGNLDIGFGISTLVTAPRLIAGFRMMTPDSRITLNDLPSREQHQRLLGGRLDVGFCRAPEEVGELSFMPVLEERLALVLSSDTEIPPRSRLSTLNSLGFVALSPSRGPGLDAQISRWCTSARFRPRIIQHADDVLTIHAVVAAGLGAAFLPWHGVEALGNRTHQQPLSGPASKWPVGICWRSADINPLLLRFVDYVSTHR
ncbi:LysR family transcriptional regulator [Labrys miyagiensis]|uniref:LysR family transcriptional regulator n=1 Tax=Labrys miyagiensis TaxID=346912 RepID=A0ABQ6CS79_9HYPH|nr:LysR substrate-binding domain-containing protein [Labrys miyagiensis]GLS23231.1 LysR family transcriptional regulator [Labrys miyagiensis]